MNEPINFVRIAEKLVYTVKEPLIFNSGFFLFFFLICVFIYQFLYKDSRARVYYLTIFSLYFYYKSSGLFFILLAATALADFIVARWLDRMTVQWKRLALISVSIFMNFGFLAYFKYTNFFLDSVSTVSGASFSHFDIFLPVGISFYTFQTLSYTLDVYRRQLKPVSSFVDFCFFVSFFPQLVAGPIVRASDFLPQIHKKISVSSEQLGRALYLILAGLFKKAVIADYISTNFVDRIFDNPLLYSGVENLLGLYGYALQIYCDFSGYSDMAIGLALLLGFDLRINFNSPYQSSSITEFWRRWHISLSSWLKDYLYISLGGNKKGHLRQYGNLMITMLLGGLWHGASWKFVAWGGLHGVGLAFDKKMKEKFPGTGSRFWKIIGIISTFHFVCLSWIFFRASSFSSGIDMIKQIFFDFKGFLFPQIIEGYPLVFFFIIIGFILHFTPPWMEKKGEEFITRLPLVWKVFSIVAMIWLIMQVKSADIQPFIYFQF